MDPSSLYTYPPPNLLLQQSKLATYMNLNSVAAQPVDNELHTSPEMQQHEVCTDESDFMPGLYFPSSNNSPPKSPINDIFNPENCIISSSNIVQENVGGTTYFFAANNENVNNGQVSHVQHQMLYSEAATNLPLTGIESGLTSSYQLRESLRTELLLKNELTISTPSPIIILPRSVEQYVDLVPLEDPKCDEGVVSATTYRVTHSQTGQLFAMRRLHDFNFAFTKLPQIIDQWKKIVHPNMVQLHEVFSTKVFGDQSLIFIFDYYAGSLTLYDKYLITNRVGVDDVDPFNSDPDAPRPYTHQKNTILRATHSGVFMPENLIWNILIQITAALRVIHSAGLSCWYLHPTKIIVCGPTIRIAWGGVSEVINVASCGSAGVQMSTEEAQQEDLNALGRMIVGLACQSNLPLDPRMVNIYMQTVTRDYSNDLKNLLMYLLNTSIKNRSLLDLMPMIGARFYTFTEALQRRIDGLEDQLLLELDNGRLYKLLVKLNIVVDRHELNMDRSWSETGDRYMLKLFRDYIFHAVTEEGRPWLDNAHIVHCLNELDCGTTTKIQLVSRDEHSILVVSYHELSACLQRAFGAVLEATLMGC